MNQLEMLKKMFENPKRKATEDGGLTYIAFDEASQLRWYGQGNKNTYICNISKEGVHDEWEIIEPERKLKQMPFGEAFYELVHNPNFKYGDWFYCDIKSVITGYDLEREWEDVSKEEFEGLWTVERVYEDVSL